MILSFLRLLIFTGELLNFRGASALDISEVGPPMLSFHETDFTTKSETLHRFSLMWQMDSGYRIQNKHGFG